LLDHRIIEFVAQLPEQLKMKGTSKKHLLKEIVHDYVPKEMMERPKMGFGVPVFDWLRNESALLCRRIYERGCFCETWAFQKGSCKTYHEQVL
jgi:asparagine synthase (glutamine-hydrolysing)